MSEGPADQRQPEEERLGLGDVPLLLFIRGLFFVSVVVALVLGLHYYLGVRLIRNAQIPEPYASAAWIALWSAFACIPVGVILGRLLPRRISGGLQWLAFLWMGTFGVVLSATAFTD